MNLSHAMLLTMPDHPPQPSEKSLRDRVPSSGKKRIVMILTLIMFTTTMDFMVLMPLGPKLMSLFSISPQQFSFLVSIYSFTAGICGFLGSLIFDRIDRKYALLGAYVGFLLGTVFCAFATSYSILLIARAVSGAFGGLLSGISYAVVGDLFSIHERGQATGKLMASYSLASILGVPTGLFLANHFGWHATFGSIVVLGSLALVLAIQVMPNIRSHLRSHYSGIFSGITENFSDKNSRTALATTLFMVHSQFVVIPFISSYLVSNTGFPENHLPNVYLLGGLVTVLCGILIGKVCDRYGARVIFKKTGLLFLIPVFFITHLGHVGIGVTLLVTTSIFALSSFRTVPGITMIASSIPPSRRGSFMSLNSCVHQLGSASATFMAGWMITQAPGTTEMTGFSHMAWISMSFGLVAYFLGQRIQLVS